MQDDQSEKSGRPEIDPLREQMMKRTDLTPYIDQVLSGTFEPTVPNSELELVFDVMNDGKTEYNEEEFQEALMIWENAKIERNTCVAIFANEVWKVCESLQGELVINLPRPDEQNKNKIYSRMEASTGAIFAKATKIWQAGRDASLQKPEQAWTVRDKAYARLKKITHFGAANELSTDKPGEFIERGAETAAAATWGLMRMIGELARLQNVNLTKEELEEIFTRAFGPFISPFASMNKEVGVALLERVGLVIDPSKSGVDTRFFRLVKDSSTEKYKLSMDHQALFSEVDHRGVPIINKDPSSETTWCPARYSVGNEKNVIKAYFDWVVELGDQYVFPKMEQDGKERDQKDQDRANRIRGIFTGSIKNEPDNDE